MITVIYKKILFDGTTIHSTLLFGIFDLYYFAFKVSIQVYTEMSYVLTVSLIAVLSMLYLLQRIIFKILL